MSKPLRPSCPRFLASYAALLDKWHRSLIVWPKAPDFLEQLEKARTSGQYFTIPDDGPSELEWVREDLKRLEQLIQGRCNPAQLALALAGIRGVVEAKIGVIEDLRSWTMTAGEEYGQPSFRRTRCLYLLVPGEPARRAHGVVAEVLTMLEIKTILPAIPAGASGSGPVRVEAVRAADLLIADVTHVDKEMAYHLGFACALEKPVVQVAEESADDWLPEELTQTPILRYGDDGLEDFRYGVRETVERLIRRTGLPTARPRRNTAS